MKIDKINLAIIYPALLQLVKEITESPQYWNFIMHSKEKLLSQDPRFVVSTEYLRERELRLGLQEYNNFEEEGWFHNGIGSLESKVRL